MNHPRSTYTCRCGEHLVLARENNYLIFLCPRWRWWNFWAHAQFRRP